MNIANVNNRRCRGFTLTEILVATLLSTFILAAVSGFMLTIAKRVHQETITLLLHNTASETMRFIQNEIRRAGQNTPIELYLTQKGKPWYIEDNSLNLYYKEGEEYQFSSIKADSKAGKLSYCSMRMIHFVSSPSCRAYYSLFDNKQFRLRAFKVDEIPATENIQAAIISIVITAESIDSNQSHTLSAMVSPRYSQRL